jgi:hypothetical protein
MAVRPATSDLGSRLARLARPILGFGLGIPGVLFLFELPGFLPLWIVRNGVEWSFAALVVVDGLVRGLSRLWPRGTIGHWLRRFDAVAGWALRRGLAFGFGALAVAWLASWVPHYLTWPWCRDPDTFASLARAWDQGILPYRDIRAYNFPGTIYLFWLLGKTVGWDRPWAFYALDAALVVSLGVAITAWSRRRLGGALPGLMAYTMFLALYLGLEYEQVAERDWQATFFVALALFAAESWPGRRGRLASAVATAAAFCIRPHVVLFLPALVSAIDEGARRWDEPLRRTFTALVAWALALVVGVILAFAPLILAGVLDDLMRGLRVAAYGGPYSRASPERALATFWLQFRDPRVGALLTTGLAAMLLAPPEARRVARTWTLALFAALFYRPLHPVGHAYLALPLDVIAAISLAPAVAWLVRADRLPAMIRLLGVLLIGYEAIPEVPRFYAPAEAFAAFGPLWSGREPIPSPIGVQRYFLRGSCYNDYCWPDYRDLLDYLRHQTGPDTPVANVLRRVPFPSLNGPTGRPSPFRAESGICWMWLVRDDLDAAFAADLERAPDSVVVWVPDEPGVDPRIRLDRLTTVIRRDYRPAARFGVFEVWRRKASSRLSSQGMLATGPGSG